MSKFKIIIDLDTESGEYSSQFRNMAGVDEPVDPRPILAILELVASHVKLRLEGNDETETTEEEGPFN